ncbi:MAG: hypothetical protein ACR2JO_03530 [Mycobacteriales bacterium]
MALLMTAAPGVAGPNGSHRVGPLARAAADKGSGGSENGSEILDGASQYAAVRTAPGTTVSSAAFAAARAQAARLGVAGRTWKEVTDIPYQNDTADYRDPFWSNSGAGWGLVSGRMTALDTDGDTVYAGAADGGVWKSTNRGGTWTPLFQNKERIAVGALTVNPRDHSVWVGTGEANTAFENYAGAGIYRSADGGRTFSRVGQELRNSLVSHIAFDGVGHVYASTSRGLLRRGSGEMSTPWATVLKPDPNPTNSPYRGSFFTDVKVKPGSDGKYVLAALGWRGGTLPEDIAHNGWYVSTTGGQLGSWKKITPGGDVDPSLIGRTTFSWSSNGAMLYAVVENPNLLNLQGVYRTLNDGNPAGPWRLVADAAKLARSGSALAKSGGTPGQQAWYNQYVLVDPKDAGHVYLGLEEIFESTSYGAKWSTIGPYWNFPLPCWNPDPNKDTCPDTTHPDQHAAIISPDGTFYGGNDGGVWRRPTSLHDVVSWTDLNRTLHTLQYYYAGIGQLAGGNAIWGGTQDNGVTLQKPNANRIVSPFGGDGGDVIVDPNNANKAVVEYVFLNMARTQNGGRSDGSNRSFTTISPACASFEFTPDPCDPNPRFIAPFEADIHNINHWVAGGQMIWDNHGKGWNTVCNNDTCDWKIVRDLGAGAQTTAVEVSGKTIYAGWCGNGCNPGRESIGQPFISGIDTNYGGTWHRVHAPVLPNRIVTALTVDPANAAHVYATYGAFSRRWIPGGGVGHVFESRNGGSSWTDISGNLPDIPTNDLVIWKGRLVVGTDIGVFASVADHPGSWYTLGRNLPNTSVNDLVPAPNGNYLIAATHGRGLWKLDLS